MSYRALFPIFEQPNMHYLDTGATSQKPQSVIQAIQDYYQNQNGNPGRGSHRLSVTTSALVEEVRSKVKKFINASEDKEILFTKNTTESINLVAYSYGLNFLKQGDEILLAVSNHHANIVPWQMVSEKTGAVLKYVYLDPSGQLDLDDYYSKLNKNTKLVALSAVVNATGVIQPYRQIISAAKRNGSITLLDAAQSIAHIPHDATALDVDFLAFSGHKMFASMGVGILYGKKELLQSMPPFLLGGDMIEFVEEQSVSFTEIPHRFEAGTKDVGSIVSLGSALDFIQDIGYENITAHEKDLLSYATQRLSSMGGIELYHNEHVDKVGVLAFNVHGVHSHDTAYILDSYGVMVRSGHHCAQPLMKHLGIPSCCRASFSLYNDHTDVDALADALKKVKEVFLK